MTGENKEKISGVEVRHEIKCFAEALERHMRYNESRGKTDQWKEDDPKFLLERLNEEVCELRDEIYPIKEINNELRPGIPEEERIQHESKDVGCLAFFIWYNSLLREIRSTTKREP